MSNEKQGEQTPWEKAAKELGLFSDVSKKVIRAACEEHAAMFLDQINREHELHKKTLEERNELKAENERLQAQLKLANQDSADDDTAIRECLRPILGDAVEGDSYGVPGLPELVEMIRDQYNTLAARMERLKEALVKITKADHEHSGLMWSIADQAIATDVPPPADVPF